MHPETVRFAADALLNDLHRRGWFNGAVVLGTDREIYAGGFGYANVNARVFFTPDTPADAASITKTLTAATVFMLVKEGRLDLRAPVQRYVPAYPDSQTTVLHLLTHSGGLPAAEYDYFVDRIPADRIRTTSLLVDVLRSSGFRPEFRPGSRFQYSSFGFDVAALAVEQVTQRPWVRMLEERVFRPLGMQHSFLRPARLSDWSGVRTLSYRREGDSLVVHDVFDLEQFYGGSNLYMSARDLFRWSSSFYSAPVLDSATLQLGYSTPAIIGEQRGIRATSGINLLGWYHSAVGNRYHYPGSLQGFWSSAFRDEDKGYAVVFMSNNSMPQWLRPLLTRALIDIMEGRVPDSINETRYIPIGSADSSRFVGRYVVDGIGRVEIRSQGDRVLVRTAGGLEYRAFFVGDGQLYVPGMDVWIGFPWSASDPFRRLTWLSIFHVGNGERSAE